MPGYSHNIWVDAANTRGLVDWLLAKVRTDSFGKFSFTLDESQTPGDITSNEPPTTDNPQTDTPITDKPGFTDTATDITNPTDTRSNDGQKKKSILVPVIIGSVTAATIAVVTVVFVKKKKM